MKKEFNLYEELKAIGFEESKDQFGFDCLIKKYERETEVLWHGKQIVRFEISARFNPDHSVVTVFYYNGGHHTPFKTKTHLNEKRALNAIRETAKNNSFEL